MIPSACQKNQSNLNLSPDILCVLKNVLVLLGNTGDFFSKKSEMLSFIYRKGNAEDNTCYLLKL